MRVWNIFLLLLLVAAIVVGTGATVLVLRGFSAKSEPSSLERVLARRIRNLAIPRGNRNETNPWKVTSETLKEAREHFTARCAICHGQDGRGGTQIGRGLYPRVPDLLSPETQSLTDGEIHYIIANGVRLTGMPAWSNPHQETDDDN
jgi:mono/diheme cytochrome c family protein